MTTQSFPFESSFFLFSGSFNAALDAAADLFLAAHAFGAMPGPSRAVKNPQENTKH